MAAGLLGGPVGAGHLDRVLGHVLAVSEVGVLLLIVLAALVGSRTVSERAFRLLRWAADRPEPPAPEPATPEPPSASSTPREGTSDNRQGTRDRRRQEARGQRQHADGRRLEAAEQGSGQTRVRSGRE
ncbi:MAG: hypothetical protein HOV97_19945 [Nonomuraea sp.]|nr:hypothetical protein [Nonomuraea sp.]